MATVTFLIKTGIYLLAFVVSFYALQAVNYEKLIKANHVNQAQILYFLMVAALGYLVGSFLCVFMNV